MKRLFFTAGMLCVTVLSIAQSVDSVLQNKYWVYRDRYLKFFTHVGGIDPGESLPMDVIVKDLKCGSVQGDRIQAGDVMAAMGEYLGVLATEYKLLKPTEEYEKFEACKNELYYAIRAIDRADRFAERFFDPSVTTDVVKGFLVRDDIREAYYQYWENTDGMAFHSSHTTSGFIPDSILVTGPNDSVDYVPPRSYPWLPRNGAWPLKATNHVDFQGAPFNGFMDYKFYESSLPGIDCGKVRNLTQTRTDPERLRDNEMSQDHALGVLLGLRFIQKMINDESLYIKPTDQDSGMYVMAETRVIADRIMTHLSRKGATIHDQTFLFPNLVRQPNGTTDTAGYTKIKFDSANYIIMNPVTNLPVKRGWEAFGMSHGYKILGELLTNQTYPYATLDIATISQVSDASGASSAGQKLTNYMGNRFINPILKASVLDGNTWAEFWTAFPYYGAHHLNVDLIPDSLTFTYPILGNDTTISVDDLLDKLLIVNPPITSNLVSAEFNTQELVDDVAMQMFLRLGAVTGSWSHPLYHGMAENYDFEWFELMYATINDKTPILPKSYYDSLLSLSSCQGISKWALEIDYFDTVFDGNGQVISIDTAWYQPHAPFNKSSVFSLPHRAYNTPAWVPGDFNGLDYMLLHNMYRLKFANSLESPTFTRSCPCQSTVATMFGADSATGLRDIVTSLFRFPEYRNIGIRIPEYISHDINLYESTTTSGVGKILPGGDLTICDAHVTLFDSSSIEIYGSNKTRRKELRVNNGGILELNDESTLLVDTFGRVVIEPGGILRVRPGSQIILDRGASLEIMGTLELMQNAIFSVTPGTYGQGYVLFKNNGENSTTARAKIVAQSNTAFSLSGPYKGYKIMEIAGNKPIVFPEVLKDSIWDGLVEMGANSTIEIQGSLYTHDLDVTAKDTNTPYNVGFLTLGQDNIDIRHTDFSYGKVGISSHTYLGGKVPSIAEVEMYKMDVGVFSEGGGFNIQGEFDECTEAIYLVKPSEPGKVQNTRLEDGAIGITYDGQSTGSLRLRYGTVKNNQAFGVYGMNGSMLIECSTFDGNTDGLYLEFNPLVSINENQQAGGSIFKNAVSNVMYEGAGGFQLDLTNGHSSFKSNTYLFDGYLKNHSALIPPLYPATQYKLSSSYNYWDFYTPYQYDLKYFIGNQGKLNAATVNLDHSNHYASETSLITKQSDLCPSYGTGSGQFQTTGAGSMFIDADNQLINNSYYTNATLSDVFDDVNDVMYYQEEYLTAFNHTKSVFDFALGPLSKFDQYVMSRLYRTMMEAYGHIMFDDGLLIDKTGLTTELLGTMDNLETKGQNPLDSFWVSQNLMVNMDIAEIYRINDHRDTALSVLVSTRGNLTETDEITNIDKFICVIEAEKDVIDGIKSPYEMEVMDCYTSGTVPPLPFSEEHDTKDDKDKPFVEWQPQPNPAETGVEVVFNLKTNRYVEIEIYDILGHKLVSQERTHYKRGQNTVSFDVQDWPTGMYFVKFNYDDYSDSKRLVIKR